MPRYNPPVSVSKVGNLPKKDNMNSVKVGDEVYFFNVAFDADRIDEEDAYLPIYGGVITDVDDVTKICSVDAYAHQKDVPSSYLSRFKYDANDGDVLLSDIEGLGSWTCVQRKCLVEQAIELKDGDKVMLSNFTFGTVLTSSPLTPPYIRYVIEICIKGQPYQKLFFANGHALSVPDLKVIHRFKSDMEYAMCAGPEDIIDTPVLAECLTAELHESYGYDGRDVKFEKSMQSCLVLNDEYAGSCHNRRVKFHDGTIKIVKTKNLKPLIIKPSVDIIVPTRDDGITDNDLDYGYNPQVEENIKKETIMNDTWKIKNKSETATEDTAISSVIDEAKAKAKSNAIMVAKMTVGRTVLKRINKIMVKSVPMMFRGYVEEYSQYSNMIVSFGLSLALQRLYPDNERVNIICESMELASNAMLAEKGSDFIESLLDNIDIPPILFGGSDKPEKKKRPSKAAAAVVSDDD